MKVIKKDGTVADFDPQKIIIATTKSANRINVKLNKEQYDKIIKFVYNKIEKDSITVLEIHGFVEQALDLICPSVAKSYKDYRNYKTEFSYSIVDDIERQVNNVLNEKDYSNSNSNTKYISTKRTSIAQIFAKEMYQKIFLNVDVRQAIRDGYIYLHDLSDLILPQFNCCLIDAGNIMNGGFNLEGYHYTEPKDIRTAVGQLSDIMMIESGQHFGGLTVPEVEKILSKYYKLEIEKQYKELLNLSCEFGYANNNKSLKLKAKEKAYIELKQSMQGLEIKFNTVVSSRGSYPFTTFTFGDINDEYEYDVCRAILEVRMEGHGDIGFKKTCIFPKLVFLYNTEKNQNDDLTKQLFDLATRCSSKWMYPDYLSDVSHKHGGKWCSPIK